MGKLIPRRNAENPVVPGEGDATIADDGELAELATAINAFHAEGKKLLDDAIDRFAAAGNALWAAKAKVRHGEWLPWLKKNFPFTQRTAQLYMRLASYLLLRPDLRSKTHGLSLKAALDTLSEEYNRDRQVSALDLRGIQLLFLDHVRSAGAALAAAKAKLGDEAFAKWVVETLGVPAQSALAFIGSSETINNTKQDQPLFLPPLPRDLAALEIEDHSLRHEEENTNAT